MYTFGHRTYRNVHMYTFFAPTGKCTQDGSTTISLYLVTIREWHVGVFGDFARLIEIYRLAHFTQGCRGVTYLVVLRPQ